MSDRSSESSCEWVLLNEGEADISSENVGTQAENLEINYDSVCLAAAESIKSSLSGEELEWEYDRLEIDPDLPPYDFSHVDDFDCGQMNMEYAVNVSKIEDLDISNCISMNNYEEEIDIDIASISKTRCYKHNRNDRLNFILDIMLALVTSLVFGLGTGHFLAWYHKCHLDLPQARFGVDHAIMSNHEIIKQNVETFIPKETEVLNKISFSKNLPNSFMLDTEDENNSANQGNCKELLSSNIDTGTNIPETSILMNEPLSINIEIAQSNFSDSELFLYPNVFPQVDWNGISNIAVTVKNVDEHLSDLEEASVVDIDHILKIAGSNAPAGNFEELNVKNKDSYKENSLISQLGKDLNKVIQTLGTIVHYQVSDGDKKYSASQELELIKFYSDFQNIINAKLSFIDDFVQSIEYKNYQKFGVKHLQKMVYSLVDSVDYLMKMSIRTLKNHRKLDTYKFSKNLSKIIFNFDKKWEKNQRSWYASIEKMKSQEFKDRSFNREGKNWKKKVHFDKDSNKNYKRYSMK